ncbi:G-patch domain-containing protein [Colletotrichum zoysiae]|uniref:Protein SQS1 n=1 Tax=Colletotrichum zoysiae TaxID=1216348 RepID=A0AAD9HAL1_9PEZI|nr:G-patch domain-containing protein [Colletotrichum zoysiae]
MPRGGKRGGGARAPPRNVPRPRSRGSDRPALNSVSGTGSAGFTLQDEARSTAHRSSPWTSDSRLRHRPVTFVNIGASEPLKQLEVILQQEEHASQHEETQGSTTTREVDVYDALSDQPDEPASTSKEAHIPDETPTKSTDDLAGSSDQVKPIDAIVEIAKKEVNVGVKPQLQQEMSTAPPFFLDITGDKNLLKNVPVQHVDRSPSPVPSDSSEEVILFRGRNKASGNEKKQKQKTRQRPFNLWGIESEIRVVEKTVRTREKDSIGESGQVRLNLSRQVRQDTRTQKRQEEDDMIADYIANMREYGDDEGLIPAQAYSRRDIGGSLSESENINESLQTLSAPDEATFVLGDDKELDRTGPEANIMSQAIDAELPQKAQRETARGNTTRVDDVTLTALDTDVSYLGSLDQSHAEDASPQSETTNEDIEDDAFALAADRFAYEVDDFDFMDWSRPALKRKGKGAKGKVPAFDISDPELEGKLQAAWKSDRLRKAERKKERQALRTQGLLGKHANPEDLRIKYPHGMGLDQIADELRTFLLGTQPSLTLPPMDNHARKVIHELASKFNIKSKSTGSGDQRRPMLHRTFRTMKFADETFDMAIARVGRKYFPRNDTAVRAAVQRQSARRGGGHAGVVYRDGEVVGGSAPELGQENKGRAMLEKMGWSSGTALGALDNKGILQPVVHVVKRSKAGLG